MLDFGTLNMILSLLKLNLSSKDNNSQEMVNMK